MKKAWLDHVRDTRDKNNRGKKTCSYREAMRLASTTWQAKNANIERIRAREARRPNNEQSRSKGTKESSLKGVKLP